MLCFPNCKINIGLYVTSKRDDGYHNIETVFYPAPVNDVLEIVPAQETKLHSTGLQVPWDGNDNLVIKAYNLLKEAYPGKIPPLDIHLHKAVPTGAGLGGGSADGSFMLRLLNDTYHLGIDNQTLINYALQLGSDCPFFVMNTPQFATGRGEEMTPVGIDLSGYSIQVICPELHVSTRRAFGMMKPKPAPVDLRTLGQLPIDQWKDKVGNDFEEPVFILYPQLQQIKEQLYAHGAIYAAMSGSGSALYGIFPKGKKAFVASGIDYKEFYSET